MTPHFYQIFGLYISISFIFQFITACSREELLNYSWTVMMKDCAGLYG